MWVAIYGSRVRRDRLGVVADYCAICRDLRPFSLFRVSQVYHLWFVMEVPGPYEHHEIQCETCGTVFLTDPTRYSTFHGGSVNGVEALGNATHPGLLERYHRELVAVRRIREKRLTREQRWALLIEPFLSLRVDLDGYDEFFGLRRKVAWILLEIACLFFVLLIVGQLTELTAGVMKTVVLVGIPALVVASWLFFRLLRRRHIARALLPMIGRSLATMQPAFGEVAQLMEYCREKDNPITKCVRLDHLWWLIQNPDKIGGRAYCRRIDLDELGVEGTLLSHWTEMSGHQHRHGA